MKSNENRCRLSNLIRIQALQLLIFYVDSENANGILDFVKVHLQDGMAIDLFRSDFVLQLVFTRRRLQLRKLEGYVMNN